MSDATSLLAAGVVPAALSTLCFDAAKLTSRRGLATIPARVGAGLSVPTAALLLVAVAPFTVDVAAYRADAALLFLVVGLFFPALVTIVTFVSNARLGPTVTSAVSGTAPLFAMLIAAALLGEAVAPRAAVAAVGVALGVALLSGWPGRSAVPARRAIGGVALLWPLAGSALRGLAQTLARVGLLLWPDPVAAAALGYCVSALAVSLIARGAGRPGAPPWDRAGVRWFRLTGVLNGAAVLLMYLALRHAPVAIVAPIVATYPAVTMLFAWLVDRRDRPDPRRVAGVVLTVASVVWLVAR